MSLIKRAISGSFASAAGFALTFAQAILVVPVLLGAWGGEGYGLWLAITAAQALLTAADTGHQNYIGNAFNGDVQAGPERIRTRLASALGVGLLLGILQCAACAALWFGGGLPRLLGVDADVVVRHEAGSALLVLAVVWAVFGSTAGILVRLYAPYGLFARGQWISTIQRVGQLLLLVGVALAGGGLLAYAWGFAAYSVFVALFWFPGLRRAIPAAYPWWRGFSAREAWKNLRASGWLTASSVLTNLSGNGVNLLLAAMLSAGAIPAFSTLRTVANVGFQFAIVLVNPLYPDIVKLALAREHAKLAQIFAVVRMTAGLPLCLGQIVLGPFIEPLFNAWTRGHVEFSPWLYATLVFAVLVRTLATPYGAYLSALNHVRPMLFVTVAQLAALLLVAAGLVPWLGVLAFGLGVLAGEVAGAMASYVCCLRVDRETLLEDRRTGLPTLGIPLAVMAISLTLGATGRTGLAAAAGGVGLCVLSRAYLDVVRMLPELVRQKLARLAPAPFRDRLLRWLSPAVASTLS